MLFRHYRRQYKDSANMNWISRIKYILGAFWSIAFQDLEFLKGVMDSLALCGKMQEARHANWEAGLIAKSTAVSQSMFPDTVYIDITSVRAPYTSFDGILNGEAIGDIQQGAGWVAKSLYPINAPYWLSNHVINATKVFVSGFDFICDGQNFLFYTDPKLAGLPTLKITDAKGVLRTYFVLFSWTLQKAITKDAVTGILNESVDAVASEAWTVHQCGATYYNVKQLLGAVSGSVVCEQAGVVRDVWEEQGYACMLVGDKMYSAKAPVDVNYSAGMDVVKGSILLGSMKFFSGRDLPDSGDVPGIRVRTDVGELVALNVNDMDSAYNPAEPQHRILPLTGNPVVVDAYRSLCYSLSKDIKCPYTEVAEKENPFVFVMNKIRRGRGCFVSLTSDTLQSVDPALAVIRNSICASGILNVFVKAKGDVAGVTVSGFTAKVGNAAVSVDATITVKQASAKLEVFK